MRRAFHLSTVLALSTAATAQINVLQHAGAINGASRGIPGNVDGWAHNGYKIDRQGGGIGSGIYGWTASGDE